MRSCRDKYTRTLVVANRMCSMPINTRWSLSQISPKKSRSSLIAFTDGADASRISARLREILLSSELKVATQKYRYKVAGNEYGGENVYGILHAPRGDATEAIVLVAAWNNMDGEPNTHGVALALTLTRYFKRRFQVRDLR